MEKQIKKFCIENSKKAEIDFGVFKEPSNLFQKFGKNNSLNTFKGELFELLLTELFEGNGYLVNRMGKGGNDGGCDLLVKFPHDTSIKYVIQAKNWKKAIDISDIDKEWSKFIRNYKKQNNLNNSNFCFIAWNYVKGIQSKIKSELNINIWDEQDIISNLFMKYKSQHPKYPSIQLNSYQESAFKNILRFWRNNKRCYVEQATGTGKTYIIAKIVETLITNKENRILIVSPSSFINKRIKELVETVIPGSRIAMKPIDGKVINILTYQYLYHNATKISTDAYTHIIMDEAHRAGAPKWNKLGILPIINNSTKIVGLSATMERYSKGLDVKKFLDNNCAGKLSLFRAIAQGFLPAIGKYVYSVLDLNSKINEVKFEVNSKYKKFPKKKEPVLRLLDAKQIKDYSIQNILFKYYHLVQYQKILVFCEGLDHVNEVRRLLDNTFTKFSNVKIERITSRQSKTENERILSNFENTVLTNNQISIIVAIDMLNEGIDVKGIDSIMLFRKTESPRVYFQQIGRVLRNQGKENPLIFDCVLNYQNVKINIQEELQTEVTRYTRTLKDIGFKDIEIQKTTIIHDEVKVISEIIKEVETKLNFYRSYKHAKEAVWKLGIRSESQYKKDYLKDPRLPSKPHRTYSGLGWIDYYDFFGTDRPNFYLTYQEAQAATQKLGIVSAISYKTRYKEDSRLPSQPDRTYKKKGWISWSDYFGLSISTNYETYTEAKFAASELHFKSYTDYRNRYYEDPRLPSKPELTYKYNGWKGYSKFLGLKEINLYQSLDEAKKAVKKLKINTEREYRKRFAEDERLPATPSRFYKEKGWVDNYHFFGKPKPKYYLKYLDAKNAVKKLSIKSREEYKKKYSLDDMLPSDPAGKYKGIGWVNYYEFFDVQQPNFYQSYVEAKKAVIKIGIKSRKEYVEQKRYKEDTRLPSQPNSFYKKSGWTNWNDFLGNTCYTYTEAERAVRQIGVDSKAEYISYKKHNEDPLLPSDPEKYYKHKGWVNWYYFLGKETPSIYSYKDAEKAVRRLNIKSMKEYKVRRNEDPKLPSSPSECYKNKGWIDSSNFLNIKKTIFYETYKEAQKASQKLGILTETSYRKLYKKDPKLTSTPNILYKTKGWKNWSSFLDTGREDIYRTYSEAKIAVQQLGVKSAAEYKIDKAYKKDPRLPSSPSSKYKNKGWISFYDFLGTKSPIKYATYKEAKRAAQKLKITSRKEYQNNKRYLEDLGLTCNPDRKFKTKGWVNWEDFLGY